MKRLLLIISILALVLVPIGCSVNVLTMIQNAIESALSGLEATYMIEVSGTEGLNFMGRYVVVTAAYDPETYVAFNSTHYDISGSVPKQYTVTGAVSVAGMFQKLSDGNETLEVKIYRGTTNGIQSIPLVDSANTTESFGAVFVTAVKIVGVP